MNVFYSIAISMLSDQENNFKLPRDSMVMTPVMKQRNSSNNMLAMGAKANTAKPYTTSNSLKKNSSLLNPSHVFDEDNSIIYEMDDDNDDKSQNSEISYSVSPAFGNRKSKFVSTLELKEESEEY